MDFANIVAEKTNTTGIGAYSLAGALTNTRTFLAALTDGESYGYRIEHINGTTVGYEIGIGTWDATAQTLSRDTIEDSSNADAAVNWPAGEKLIEITVTAGQIKSFASANYIDSSDAGGVYGTLTGAINGSNPIFTVSQGKYDAGTLEVYYNGVLQSGVEVTETTPGSGIFTLSFAPKIGTTVMVKYRVTP